MKYIVQLFEDGKDGGDGCIEKRFECADSLFMYILKNIERLERGGYGKMQILVD